jgi:hypothetical protein
MEIFEVCRRAHDASALGVKRIGWNITNLPDDDEHQNGETFKGVLDKEQQRVLSTILVEEHIHKTDVEVLKPTIDPDGRLLLNQGLKADGYGKLPPTAKISGALRRLELDAGKYTCFIFLSLQRGRVVDRHLWLLVASVWLPRYAIISLISQKITAGEIKAYL